jgi:HK97 family phage portal protein
MPPYPGGRGRGVIDTHSLDLGLAATVRSYASGVFQSGVPAGYLKSTQPNMTAERAAELKAAWLAQHGGARRSIAVLNATTDFHAVSISPVDAQLTTSREWSLRDTALAFGVPPYMLGVPGDSSTYANVESRMIELRTFTLLPWQRRIETVLSAQLPRATNLKIRSDGLLRADTKTRYDSYKIGIDAGFLTVDEVRALEDRAPLETVEEVGVA